jgi:WXG100 family type VII secretion target
MSRIRLDPSDFHASVADLQRACDDIEIARASARAKVAQLLDGGWSGPASEAFADAWSDWVRSSAVVSSELSGIAASLLAIRTSFMAADDSVASSFTSSFSSVSGRLG